MTAYCFMHKIVHNLIALKFDDFLKFDTNNVTGGQNLKLRTPLCRSNSRLNFSQIEWLDHGARGLNHL